MKKTLVFLVSAAFVSVLSAADPVNLFQKERFQKTEVLWNKYDSPEFVNVEEDGIIKLNVVRKPGGPVGGGMKYYISIDQKAAAPITVSAESMGEGFKTKTGYNYRLTVAFFFVGGGNSGDKHLYFPGEPDGKWNKVSQEFKFDRPVKMIHLHVALCYVNGEAQFKNIQILADPENLKELPSAVPAKETK